MSGYWGQSTETPILTMPSSSVPPSRFENQTESQLLPAIAFSGKRQATPHVFPQSLSAMTQFPHDMSQQRQKQIPLQMEFGGSVLQTSQHCDPTFYGLSASLPMSTYVTALSSPPPRAPKRVKQATQNAQNSSTLAQGRPQASPSYASRLLASRRPNTFYRSQSMSSRHGYSPTVRYPPIHPRQEAMANAFTCSLPSTNPYASDRPRTWNWLNTLHASGRSLDTLGQQYHNFTFTWPTISNESSTEVDLQNLPQGPGQLQQMSSQSVFPESAAHTATCDQNYEPITEFHNIKDISETRNNDFAHAGAGNNVNELVDGALEPQSTAASFSGERNPSPPQNEVRQTNSRAESISVTTFADLPELPDLDAAMFANLPNLDHSLGFEPAFDWDIGKDISTLSNARELAEDVGKQILAEDVGKQILAEEVGKQILAEDVGKQIFAEDIKNDTQPMSSDDSELWELLQPVVSSLASGSYSPRNCFNDAASQAISVPDKVSGCSAGDETFFREDTTLEIKSRIDLCPATADTESNGMAEGGPINWGTRSKFTSSDASPSSTPSIGNRSALKALPTVLGNSILPPSTERGRYEWSLKTLDTTSGTIPDATAIGNSTPSSVDASVEINSSWPPSPKGRGCDEPNQNPRPHLWQQAKSSSCVTQNPPGWLQDVQEWLDRRYTDLGQPVALKCKMSPTTKGKRIYGWQVVWADGNSETDDNQPRLMTAPENERLEAILRRNITISRGSPASCRYH